YRPDVLLWEVPDSDSLSGSLAPDGILTAQLTDYSTEDPPMVLLLPETSEPTSLTEFMGQGVSGLLVHNADEGTIVAALTAAINNLIVIDPIFVETLVDVQPTAAPFPATADDIPLIEPLTPREQEVLEGLADGLTNKQIARELAISEHTVKFHINSIFGKLGAQSRTEAVVLATRAGILML
ncbi:MAG: response regulator transcription factor, partial [Chloroflexota bacterium]